MKKLRGHFLKSGLRLGLVGKNCHLLVLFAQVGLQLLSSKTSSGLKRNRACKEGRQFKPESKDRNGQSMGEDLGSSCALYPDGEVQAHTADCIEAALHFTKSMEHCWARDPLELAVLVTNRQEVTMDLRWILKHVTLKAVIEKPDLPRCEKAKHGPLGLMWLLPVDWTLFLCPAADPST
ncbi:unnamed protein product [Durusdinium trenchii]|uniref:Uncharacterized protein n=2 Tax=Durusdinium trenchii TaxID=1381693 RepID=A0ABP0NYR7_9DINO